MNNITIEDLERFVQVVEDAVKAIDHHFEHPKFVCLEGSEFFRHDNDKKNDLLMSYLKCVISVSHLNACIVLLRNGYVQEIGTLCRCVEDNSNDVWFLNSPLGDDGKLNKQQERSVKEFFQEDFVNGDPANSIQPRDRVPRQKVHAEIARRGKPKNPHDAKRSLDRMHKVFSGFVHDAYVRIMDMYGGSSWEECCYHLHGFLGTPKIPEWTIFLSRTVYGLMLTITGVATRCNDSEVVKELWRQIEEFEKATGIRGRNNR